MQMQFDHLVLNDLNGIVVLEKRPADNTVYLKSIFFPAGGVGE